MADFVRVELADSQGTVFVEAAESDLVVSHASGPEVLDAASARLSDIASATAEICRSLRENVSPDELQLEIGVGMSGELGWFIAKSSLEANIKVTLTWKAADTSE